MINEPNNDKIQGVTWEWWLQLTSELQKIRRQGVEPEIFQKIESLDTQGDW